MTRVYKPSYGAFLHRKRVASVSALDSLWQGGGRLACLPIGSLREEGEASAHLRYLSIVFDVEPV